MEKYTKEEKSMIKCVARCFLEVRLFNAEIDEVLSAAAEQIDELFDNATSDKAMIVPAKKGEEQ